MTYATEHFGKIAWLTLAHAELVFVSLAAASLIAVPLGVWAARRPHAGVWILGTLGTLYTIPSLALLALLVQAVGLGFSPIFAALVVYAQFMLARSVAVGLRSVDPAQRDAANGLGMTAMQRLVRVEFPLALPIVLSGVRVAAIASIAIATLAGYVGGGGLGVLIFNGLTLHQPAMIVSGSIAASLLAILTDGTLRFAERAVRT